MAASFIDSGRVLQMVVAALGALRTAANPPVYFFGEIAGDETRCVRFVGMSIKREARRGRDQDTAKGSGVLRFRVVIGADSTPKLAAVGCAESGLVAVFDAKTLVETDDALAVVTNGHTVHFGEVSTEFVDDAIDDVEVRVAVIEVPFSVVRANAETVADFLS